jgi:hypothetical protein
MTTILIDDDEEGDDLPVGRDRVAYATEVKRLRAINQELVAALKAVSAHHTELLKALRACLNDIPEQEWVKRRHVADVIKKADLALQHAETRTP